jgi:hypothetical protein
MVLDSAYSLSPFPATTLDRLSRYVPNHPQNAYNSDINHGR